MATNTCASHPTSPNPSTPTPTHTCPRACRTSANTCASLPPPLAASFRLQDPPPPEPCHVPLLTGVALAEQHAAVRRTTDPRDRVEALKAAAARHGARVVDSWSAEVTHLVVYDGVDEREDEKLYGSGLYGGGNAMAAQVLRPQPRVFDPEEIIEALIGLASSHSAGAEEVEQELGVGAAAPGGAGVGVGGEARHPAEAVAAAVAAAEAAEAEGSGGEDGGEGRAAAARSEAQQQCLSLIRLALECPHGRGVVSGVRLVDWRWVRVRVRVSVLAREMEELVTVQANCVGKASGNQGMCGWWTGGGCVRIAGSGREVGKRVVEVCRGAAGRACAAGGLEVGGAWEMGCRQGVSC